MQVSVEQTGGLERRLTVQVPADRVEDQVTNRLRDLARRVKMDGFRPGKVPLKVVKSRYDSQVRQEVVSEVMQQTLQEALQQEDLHPAGGPKIEPKSVAPGQALEYSATFEVYPEIELAPLEGATIEKPAVEIAESDIDKMLERLQAQRTTWNEVDRAAAEGDQVEIDFEGSVDGEPFSGNQATQVPLVLGSGSMIEGFEEQLIGAKTGEHRTIEVTFPEDYRSEEVAGKRVKFEVDVRKVSEAQLPALDDEFARSFGIDEGGLDALRAEIQKNMERELEEKVRGMLKERVMDALLEANDIEVPEALVEEEIDRSLRQATQQRPELAQAQNLPREIFAEGARRRVTLGLLMGEIIRKNDIKVDPERVRSLLDSIASTYEDPEQLKQYYAQNASMRSELEGRVLEDQVVDLLLEQVEVKDKPATFDEVMNPEGES